MHLMLIFEFANAVKIAVSLGIEGRIWFGLFAEVRFVLK